MKQFTKQACRENVVASFFPLKIFIYIIIYIYFNSMVAHTIFYLPSLGFFGLLMSVKDLQYMNRTEHLSKLGTTTLLYEFRKTLIPMSNHNGISATISRQ